MAMLYEESSSISHIDYMLIAVRQGCVIGQYLALIVRCTECFNTRFCEYVACAVSNDSVVSVLHAVIKAIVHELLHTLLQVTDLRLTVTTPVTENIT